MKFTKNTTRTIAKAVLVASSILTAQNLLSHTVETDLTNQTSATIVVPSITENQAKKSVRRFLSARGFTKNIAPGGSHIRDIESSDNHWKVLIDLRQASAAVTSQHWLTVDKHSGIVTELLSEPKRSKAFSN